MALPTSNHLRRIAAVYDYFIRFRFEGWLDVGLKTSLVAPGSALVDLYDGVVQIIVTILSRAQRNIFFLLASTYLHYF